MSPAAQRTRSARAPEGDQPIGVSGHYWIDTGQLGDLAHLVPASTVPGAVHQATARCGRIMVGEGRRTCRVVRACARCVDVIGGR